MIEIRYLVFCDSDADGNITAGTWGVNIIPDRQYDHFFFLGNENLDFDLTHYKIVYDGCKPMLYKIKE